MTHQILFILALIFFVLAGFSVPASINERPIRWEWLGVAAIVVALYLV